MSISWTNLITALTTAGVSTTTIPNIIQSIGGLNSVSSKVTAELNQLAVNMNNPDVVKQIVINIESTPGVPSTVIPLLENLKTPGVSPLTVIQTISAIEQAVANANSLFSAI
jgi:hypothetical protein